AGCRRNRRGGTGPGSPRRTRDTSPCAESTPVCGGFLARAAEMAVRRPAPACCREQLEPVRKRHGRAPHVSCNGRRARTGTALLRRFEREKLGAVLAEPGALLAPGGPVSFDERPEAARVVGNPQVVELVHDHVVEHLEGREHEPPVEGERA